MKTHLYGSLGMTVCGAPKATNHVADDPQLIDCQVCRKSVKFRWYATGWNRREELQ